MNIYISYFYNIRFFPKNLIPISTAMWDPKWYHNFKSDDTVFIALTLSFSSSNFL